MRTGATFTVGSEDRRRLEAIGADRNTKQKHVWRARIILESRDGCCTVEIMRRTGKSEDLCLVLAAALHGGGCRRSRV